MVEFEEVKAEFRPANRKHSYCARQRAAGQRGVPGVCGCHATRWLFAFTVLASLEYSLEYSQSITRDSHIQAKY